MEEFENYTKEALIVDLIKANKFGLLLIIPVIILFGLPYYFLWLSNMDFQSILKSLNPKSLVLNGGLIFIVLVLGIVIHELLHGITWSFFAKNGFKSMKFGVFWIMLTPYCHCKEPLTVKHYIIGAITPAIVLGFIPSIIAIVSGTGWMLLFGVFFTVAAGGDFLIINLVRNEDWNDYVQDHPTEAGCYIYRKKQ